MGGAADAVWTAVAARVAARHAYPGVEADRHLCDHKGLAYSFSGAQDREDRGLAQECWHIAGKPRGAAAAGARPHAILARRVPALEAACCDEAGDTCLVGLRVCPGHHEGSTHHGDRVCAAQPTSSAAAQNCWVVAALVSTPHVELPMVTEPGEAAQTWAPRLAGAEVFAAAAYHGSNVGQASPFRERE